jgi:LysM repeat protein
LDYIGQKSKAAAYLILKTDGDMALRKIDDPQVVAILQLLDEKSPEAEKFALGLLTSPRSDAVWQMAAARLYGYAGESMPEKNQHHAALLRFVPQRTVIQAAAAQPAVPVAIAPPILPPPAVLKKAPVAPPIAAAKPASTPTKKAVAVNTPAKRGDKIYTVQDGDNLWKIARRFHIDVEDLRAYNKLNSDALRPGMSIRIPN